MKLVDPCLAYPTRGKWLPTRGKLLMRDDHKVENMNKVVEPCHTRRYCCRSPGSPGFLHLSSLRLSTVSLLAGGENRYLAIVMSSTLATSKPPTPVRTDADQISGWNRGAITTPFVMAPSCTDVLTLSTTKNELRLVFAHAGQEYLDPACIPIGTKAPSELRWNTYYCTSVPHLPFPRFPL